MQKNHIILPFIILSFFSLNTFSQINPGDSLAARAILDSTRLDTVSNESLSDTEVTIKKSKTVNLLSEDPCEDSLYNVLKKKSRENINDREYEYFMMKDKLCAEASKSLLLGKPILSSEVRQYVNEKRAASIPIFFLGYISLSATIPITILAVYEVIDEKLAIANLLFGHAGAACVVVGHILYAKAGQAERTGTISKVKTSKPGFYISFDF